MRLRRRLSPIALVLALVWAPAALGAGAQSAYETVQQATALLLQKLADVKGIYAEDPQRFNAEVDKAISPYVDFERFSRGVMAKYYRTATQAQRDQFQNMFKVDLIETYASALAEFDNETIIVVPPSSNEPPGNEETPVKMEVHGKDGKVYTVQYSMVLTDGEWKLRNVIVEGQNIGLIFRKKFADSMAQNGKDIDKVIAGWNSKVEQGGQ